MCRCLCIKHTGRLQLFHLLTLTKAHFDNVDDEFVIGFFAFNLLLLLLLSDKCSMWWTRFVSTLHAFGTYGKWRSQSLPYLCIWIDRIVIFIITSAHCMSQLLAKYSNIHRSKIGFLFNWNWQHSFGVSNFFFVHFPIVFLPSQPSFSNLLYFSPYFLCSYKFILFEVYCSANAARFPNVNSMCQ